MRSRNVASRRSLAASSARSAVTNPDGHQSLDTRPLPPCPTDGEGRNHLVGGKVKINLRTKGKGGPTAARSMIWTLREMSLSTIDSHSQGRTGG